MVSESKMNQEITWTQAEIFDKIIEERKRQDENWSNREQYVYNAPHLLVLETKVNRMRAMWYEGKKEDLKAEWIKIAAIAIRALEEVK